MSILIMKKSTAGITLPCKNKPPLIIIYIVSSLKGGRDTKLTEQTPVHKYCALKKNETCLK